MEEKLIVIIIDWWDYKSFFFSSLNLPVFFNFSKMNRHFCNKEKSILIRSISRALSWLRKGWNAGEGEACHAKIMTEMRMMSPPIWHELQGVSRGSVLPDSSYPDLWSSCMCPSLCLLWWSLEVHMVRTGGGPEDLKRGSC